MGSRAGYSFGCLQVGAVGAAAADVFLHVGGDEFMMICFHAVRFSLVIFCA